MRCSRVEAGRRCSREATVEYLRAGVNGSRWRPVCSSCAASLQRLASPVDRLRVRPIEVGDQDERVRRRRLDFDLAG